MTRTRSYLDLPPRVLSDEDLARIARARSVGKLGVHHYRAHISALLAHIDALQAGREAPSDEGRVSQSHAVDRATPPLRVRPELPQPGTPAFAAHQRRVRDALAAMSAHGSDGRTTGAVTPTEGSL
ncbi:MAG: hypothetical protein H3C62_01020 [Gemmatimonadaceae bacterium]|nr:hypothetical protein [Gemmatimonadaceae bacterium]